jgi:hypothetical protein
MCNRDSEIRDCEVGDCEVRGCEIGDKGYRLR